MTREEAVGIVLEGPTPCGKCKHGITNMHHNKNGSISGNLCVDCDGWGETYPSGWDEALALLGLPSNVARWASLAADRLDAEIEAKYGLLR